MKTCTKCLEEKTEDAFLVKRGHHGGRSTWCKACHNLTNGEWKKNNPESTRNSRLLNKFNLPLSRYNLLMTEQNGLCAICLQPEIVMSRNKIRALAVDHDRSCCPGQTSCGACVRGLLCHACNTALGKFKDDVAIMERAINYIKQHQGGK